jgi:thiol-disulfide isomerase/thioredoxin
VDGAAEVSIQVVVKEGGRTSYRQSHEIPLTLAPGDAKTVQLGGTGRAVVAQIVVPEDLRAEGLSPIHGELFLEGGQFIKPLNWEKLDIEQQRQLRREFEQTPAHLEYSKRSKRFVGMVESDGRLRIEDVPAGEYGLMVASYRPSPEDPSYSRWAASASADVKIEAMPGGRSEEPLDVGKLEVKRHHYLKAGDVAPLFDVAGVDGKRLRLADYRGKFVLVDFWATWCGPCIIEMETLMRLDEEFGKDGRLVMISLSTDDRIEDPKRFIANREVVGLQGYVGRRSSVSREFGVGGIPSIWLIGPDGKIIAKELYGEQLMEAVRKALEKKQ